MINNAKSWATFYVNSDFLRSRIGIFYTEFIPILTQAFLFALPIRYQYETFPRKIYCEKMETFGSFPSVSECFRVFLILVIVISGRFRVSISERFRLFPSFSNFGFRVFPRISVCFSGFRVSDLAGKRQNPCQIRPEIGITTWQICPKKARVKYVRKKARLRVKYVWKNSWLRVKYVGKIIIKCQICPERVMTACQNLTPVPSTPAAPVPKS